MAGGGAPETPFPDAGDGLKTPPPDAADLIIRGGAIVTLDAACPRVEALAARAGVITALGKAEDIRRLERPDTRVIDLKGGTAVPGLIDAHGHMHSLGASLERVDLRGAASIEEVIRRIRDRAPSGSWILGRGWDQNLWPGREMPGHRPLTDAFPERPVWLTRVDGHAGWGNAALLAAAGITRDTADPEGGEILKDAGGNPTGVLVDAAMDLVPVPPATREEIRRRILAAQEHLIARGITGAHDMGLDRDRDAVYRELAASTDPDARLAIRITGYADQPWFYEELISRKPDAWQPGGSYALVGVKLYADGALGSRGALLLAPYSDRPGHLGLPNQSQEKLDALCAGALGAGWQIATHAIGDAGNRAAIDAYERAIARHRVADHRCRIEHCQVVAPEDVPRFVRLGIIASMQPTHATSDMPWAGERLGPARLPRAYAWRRFLASGARLCFGSDFPIERADITFGLHAAVTRQDAGGQPPGGWMPDQRLTLEEAIRAFSLEAAFAARQEAFLARLRRGRQADITCFAEPIFEIPPAELRETPIQATIVRGEVLHLA